MPPIAPEHRRPGQPAADRRAPDPRRPPSRVTVLAGGIGGARFVRGLLDCLAERSPGAVVTVIGNTGDDIDVWGLRICPDLDTLMYTLGGGIDAERGWGRSDEGWRVREEMATHGEPPDWFGLGDRDIATHLLRTTWLRAGIGLAEVTERLCRRWQPGVRLLPMSEDDVRTHVELVTGQTVHFQEWWVRLRAQVPARRIVAVGAAGASPGPGVLDALLDADVVLFAPSNPVVSVGVVLAVPGIAEAVRTTTAPVVGVSPIIAGAPVRGMADACLAAIGVAATAGAVGLHYGPRSAGGLLDGWLVDSGDTVDRDQVLAGGLTARAVPLLMTDPATSAALAGAALDLAAALVADPTTDLTA
jgi:LPPG:FO 2-phospho-L-lactate transferase